MKINVQQIKNNRYYTKTKMEAKNMLEGFEQIKKERWGGNKIKEDEVSINKMHIGLGEEGAKFFSKLKNAEIWINKKERIIALKPTIDRTLAFTVYKVKEKVMVRVRKLDELLGDIRGRYKIMIKDGHLVIDLNKKVG